MNYSLRQITLSFLFLLHILFSKAICLRKRRYKNYERGHDIMSEDMIKKKRANYQFIPIPSVG